MDNNRDKLNNTGLYSRLDLSGMRDHLRRFPEECQNAWDKSLEFELPSDYAQIDSIVILGMGGSGIAGQLIRRLAILEGNIPVWVHQDYGLPPFMTENTLVIASSYSGNTEEILSAFAQTLKTPAQKLAITCGGKLGELAGNSGVPVFHIDYDSPPRVALAHIFFPVAGMLQRLGLLHIDRSDLTETIEVLSLLQSVIDHENPFESNSAKQLASCLHGKLPIIYGAGLLSEVAQRWKAQFNENSKSAAFFEVIPELCHNAIVGYEFPRQMRDQGFVILLHAPNLFPQRISIRYEAIVEIFSKFGIEFEQVEAQGEIPLAQMMSAVFYGDYVSFYLAILNDVDPTPVESINFLKKYIG